MSQTGKKEYYLSCEYYRLIFTGYFLKPSEDKKMMIWNQFPLDEFQKLFKEKQWKSTAEMIDFFVEVEKRFEDLKSFG